MSMITPQKTTHTFNFTVDDPHHGKIIYTMTHTGETMAEALKNLRANLASMINDINENLKEVEKGQLKT